MDKISKLKMVVVGQTPPPFNGQAKMIEVMLKGISTCHDVRFVRMEFSESVSMAGRFSLVKIIHLFGLIFRALKALGLRRDRYLYYPPASPNLVPVLRDILFLLVVRPFAKGLVLQFHAGGVSRYAERHPIVRVFLRMAYGRMDLGIVQGASCPDDPGYFKARLKAVVPHGIDVERSSTDGHPSATGGLRILYVGIHTAEKGLFALLETARELSSHGTDFIMHTVGAWYAEEEEQRFLQVRHAYGLDDRVICRGQQTGDDLRRAYAWADVLFFPTHYPWETMGIVQLEAMAHGIPVVASDWQGPKDVVVEGRTGFLCGADDPSAFAERLRLLADDPELRRRMGEAGLDRYKSYYTVNAFMSRMNAALESLPA